MTNDWMMALWGGVLIGISVSLMLLWNGRVTGVSGIVNGVLKPITRDALWRWYFLFGLVLGGFVMKSYKTDVFSAPLDTEDWTVVLAGLLVGFGTVMGSGCTSGHGVCGISRLSPRSLVATLVFITAGVISVVMFRQLGILP